MKLRKIQFDAFKSLFKKEFEVKEACIGFVGINESGKSNILEAISALGGSRKLTSSDTPKMAKEHEPALRFLFTLSEQESERVTIALSEWASKSTLVEKSIFPSTLEIAYHIRYDRKAAREVRYFRIENLAPDRDLLFLKPSNIGIKYMIAHQDSLVPLEHAAVISSQLLEEQGKVTETTASLRKVNEEIFSLENQAKGAEADRIAEIDADLQRAKQTKTSLEVSLNGFNLDALIAEAETRAKEFELNISALEKEREAMQVRLTALAANGTPAAEQQAEVAKLTVEKGALETKISEYTQKLSSDRLAVEAYKEPLSQKYTTEPRDLDAHIGQLLSDLFQPLLPKVVFWVHNNQYILQKETLLSVIIEAKDLSEIPRPLLNLFGIAFSFQTLDELKQIVRETQEDGSERSRYATRLEIRSNDYLKSVWPAYDQKMHVTLERDLIRAEFFDPNASDPSYYGILERSQGVQTFVSFILTVGAEAKQGVIKDTILLLDEPETHLHPSGVRYMLAELGKIADDGNTVFYATHSIFMIDRKNLSRHVILNKARERTQIILAQEDQIGRFMQEEVIYRALGFDPSDEFASATPFNFVFEGVGDAVLFRSYFQAEKAKFAQLKGIEKAAFNSGGGASNIREYFGNNPLPMNTKWVFVVDSDKPGNEIKKFLEGKFKAHVGTEILVFQYTKDGLRECELEDILPRAVVLPTLEAVLPDYEGHLDDQVAQRFQSFSIPFGELLQGITIGQSKDIQELKADFKEFLNARLKRDCSGTSPEGLKSAYPEYNSWFARVLADLTTFLSKTGPSKDAAPSNSVLPEPIKPSGDTNDGATATDGKEAASAPPLP